MALALAHPPAKQFQAAIQIDERQRAAWRTGGLPALSRRLRAAGDAEAPTPVRPRTASRPTVG